MNIITKAGSAIAKNKEVVKSILSGYNIPYGTGSTFELIMASFSAIKGGNTDLAIDISTLIVTGNNPPLIKLSRKQEKVANLISIIQSIKEGLKEKNATQNTSQNADGNAIAATASELINAISTTDVNQATNTASQAANKSMMALNIALGVSLLIMVVIILVLSGYNFKKLIPKF